MQGLRDDLIRFYRLEHLLDTPEDLEPLTKIINHLISARGCRDFLENSFRSSIVTKDDVNILAEQYARLDKWNHKLQEEIERLCNL